MIFDEKTSKELFKMINQIYKSEIPLPHTNRAEGLTNRGKQVYLEGLIDLIYNSEGYKIGFYGFARDITEKLISEQKLKKSEEKYSNLFQYSNDAIIIHDFECKILDVNDRAIELFKYLKEEFLILTTPMLRTIEE